MEKASEVVSVFDKISAINVNAHTEKKGKLSYLSWAWAWAEFKTACPDAKYEIKMWPKVVGDLVVPDALPYLYDPDLGYMVMTKVWVGSENHTMWLFCMDSSNKAMKAEPYTYQKAEWVNGQKTGKMLDVTIQPATMFEINATLMRCLVKNLAMFGLGLYIYAGEDIPGEATVQTVEKSAESELKKFKLIVCGHLAKYDIDFIMKCFNDAGYTTRAKRPESIISKLVEQVDDRDEMKMIGENIKLAVEEANVGAKQEDPKDEKPAEEVAEEVATASDKKEAEAKKKADAKKEKAAQAKAKKIADAKAALESAQADDPEPAAEAPSDADPTADDNYLEVKGPDANIKAVMPADHKPKPDEIADDKYVDFIVDYFCKMIEQTLTHEILAEYVEAEIDAWDKAALDKLFGLYKQLNEGSTTLSDVFPTHYEG